ncbi:pyridoxal-phosphate dependent enzyme, partial [Bacillus velezensis]|nr:pyridoxal-phosphate dependent enzyme [Bacillus velezensis]
ASFSYVLLVLESCVPVTRLTFLLVLILRRLLGCLTPGKHAHKTEGIGMEFIPDYMDENHFDAIYTVEDDTAFSLVREAAEKEGLLIGSSSGAALYAALEEAKKAPAGSNIVTIFPDGSDRYISKNIFQGGQ